MLDSNWLEQSPTIRFTALARRFSTKGYARLFAHRATRSGKLKQVTKGIYSSSDDIFAIASNIHFPSYISFLSGSYRHGLTEAIPITVHVATIKSHKPIGFQGYRIEFIAMDSIWGYHKEGDGKSTCFLADLEKLLLDSFLKQNAMTSFAEIENVFINSTGLDLEKLRQYLLRLGSNKVFRQVGHMLEHHKGIDISGLMPIDRNYYRLNSFGSDRVKDSKWRLYV